MIFSLRLPLLEDKGQLLCPPAPASHRRAVPAKARRTPSSETRNTEKFVPLTKKSALCPLR